MTASPTTGDWETFIAEDLVAYMDGHYRTLATRMSRGLRASRATRGSGLVDPAMAVPTATIEARPHKPSPATETIFIPDSW